MNVLEAKLEARLREGVRALGGMAEKVAPTRWGMPDRVVLLPFGQVFFVELKTDVGKLRPAQEVWHQRAHYLGTEVVVLSGAADVERWLGEQRFILRKKYDAAVAQADREEFPDDPTRNGSRGAARPYRVEYLDGDAWKVAYTYSNEKKAMARYEELEDVHDEVRLVHRGKVVARTLATPETGAES